MKKRTWGSRILAWAVLGGLAVLPARASAPAPTPADLNRASAVADAGLLDAEARLKAYFPFRAFEAAPRAYRFWGADPTELVDPPADAALEDAVNPSFAVEADGNPADATPAPRTLAIGGASRGLSGTAGTGTYAANGDHYALRVSDLSGRIHINDGIEGGPSGSVSQNLRRILNVLGEIVNEPNLGNRILAGRPAGGYARMSDLVTPLGGEASYRRVRGFLTAHAWVDRNVANPVPLSALAASRYPVTYNRGTPPVYRHGSSVDATGAQTAPFGQYDTIPNAGAPAAQERADVSVYGLDTLNAQWIEIVGRAPVNVNAAPREVLIALLSHLKGFTITERKRNNARWQGELLVSLKIRSTYAPGSTLGSEYGYLQETHPIAGPAGGPGISPAVLADEILACRNRRFSSSFNYGSVPWSGPFRNWSQFNLFVDNLVTIGVLDDPRAIHVRYPEEGTDVSGFGPLVPDDTARRQAARAIADVIKANFNPNLHLNELNPDENLHLLVDKTDLIVNSTEFCFVPTGHFEVESLGRVVRPAAGEADAFAASNNQLMAQAKASAVFKIYDLVRETSQKQFYAGTLVGQVGLPETNNGHTLEIGPEPDNGVFPGNLGAAGLPDNEWDGYLALPTVGSVWHGSAPKAKNTLVTTTSLPSSPHLNSAMHAHFTLDADCCAHPFERREIAGRSLPDEQVANYPDAVGGGPLAYPGPYDPTKGNHRLAKSFRLNGGVVPSLAPFAPSDLRIDGAYAERHSAPAYALHQGANHLWNWNTENAGGMVSFWIKPSFSPELTGKVRKFWDLSRYHTGCAQLINTTPFQMVYMPVQYNPSISESMGPLYWHNNMGKFQPSSIYFGSQQWHFDEIYTAGAGHAFGKITSCLNHLGHAGEATKPSPLRAHRWMHATVSWNLNGTSDASGNRSKLFINGTDAYTPFSYSTMTGWAEFFNRMNGFDKHSGDAYNHMRIGGTSRISDAAAANTSYLGAYPGNYSADVTVDELYVWKSAADGDPFITWMRGRYYSLRGETAQEGRFTSQALGLTPSPGGPVPPVKILGASWTWYGEETDPATGVRMLHDYGGNILGTAGRDMQPRVRLSVVDGGLTFGPFVDDGFSAVLSAAGTTPTLQNPAQAKYSIGVDLTAGGAPPILLATPVLDDVTLYWSNGRANTRVDAPAPLAITNPGSATLPDAEYGVAYAAAFSASGPAPITWSIGGALPSGLAIDPSTGALSGTPAQGGTFSFLVTATHGSETAAAQYTLTVTGAPAGGGDSGGGGCGLLGAEAILLVLALRSRGRRR